MRREDVEFSSDGVTVRGGCTDPTPTTTFRPSYWQAVGATSANWSCPITPRPS